MKKIALVFLATCMVAFVACKKSSSSGSSTSSASIVGNWKVVSVNGKSVYANVGSDDSTTYAYKNPDSVFTRMEFSTDPYTFDTVYYVISEENWSFNADGSYSINEMYSGNGFRTVSSNSSGTWQYLSNTSVNDAVLLQGQTAALLPGGTNPSYTIQAINGNTMTLTQAYSQRTLVSAQAIDIVVTLSKM